MQLLALGIPGSETTSFLLSAPIALNLRQSPRLIVDQPKTFWSVIISMCIGNLVLLVLDLPLIPYIAKILAMSRNCLISFILFFTLMGKHIRQNTATELLILVGFGVIAMLFRFTDYPLAHLLILFILEPMLENNFPHARQLYDGINLVWERPMTMRLLILTVALIVLPSYRARRACL